MVLQSVNFDVMIKDVRVHATEMMGFVGREEGLVAYAVALIEK